MPNYRQIVLRSEHLIKNSELKDILLPIWRDVEWKGHSDSIGSDVEFNRKGGTTIHLYPALERTPGTDCELKVLREFGNLIIAKAGERGQALWAKKLDAPTAEQIATASSKLKDPALFKTCKTYKDVLDTYPDKGGSVSKLVFINIMNALLANNISYRDCVGVDIMSWGPTTEYANLKKYHSLVPLVSAYSPYDIYNCYGYALASMIKNGLADVLDSSVAFALRGIVQRIAKIASPD